MSTKTITKEKMDEPIQVTAPGVSIQTQRRPMPQLPTISGREAAVIAKCRQCKDYTNDGTDEPRVAAIKTRMADYMKDIIPLLDLQIATGDTVVINATKRMIIQKYSEYQTQLNTLSLDTSVQRTAERSGKSEGGVFKSIKGYFAKKKSDKENSPEALHKKKNKQLPGANGEFEVVDTAYMDSEYVQKTVLAQKINYRHANGAKESMTKESLIERIVRQNDYSNIQLLDDSLRNILAVKFFESHPNIFDAVAPEAVAHHIETELKSIGGKLNPLVRILVSLGMKKMLPNGNLGRDKSFYDELDNFLNQGVMVDTLTATSSTRDAAGAQNYQSQIMMFKLMAMGQIGKFDKKENGGSTRWPQTMAHAFAHCSRVGFTMPAGETSTEQDQIAQNILGEKKGVVRKTYGAFFRRISSSHKLKRKQKDPNGHGLVEGKTLFNLSDQYGMNVAMGGIGNDGIPGENGQMRKIANDGTNGHLFMLFRQGDKTHHGGFLAGFESDAPGMYNTTGHVHDMKASPEFISPLGGLRVNEQGDKYGGREVDMSFLTKDESEMLLNPLVQIYESLMRDAQSSGLSQPLAQVRLKNFVTSVTGSQMKTDDLINLIREYQPQGADLLTANPGLVAKLRQNRGL